MVEVARCNEVVLVMDGDQLGLVEQRQRWPVGAEFIPGLLAAVLMSAGIGNAVATSLLAGSIMVIVGALLVWAAVAIRRARIAQQRAVLGAPWIIFDRSARVVRDPAGRVLAPFDAVRLKRVFQLASSSRALAMYYPRKLILARGNPIGDSVSAIEDALRSALAR